MLIQYQCSCLPIGLKKDTPVATDVGNWKYVSAVPPVQLFLVSMPHPLLRLCGAGSSPGRSARLKLSASGSQEDSCLLGRSQTWQCQFEPIHVVHLWTFLFISKPEYEMECPAWANPNTWLLCHETIAYCSSHPRHCPHLYLPLSRNNFSWVNNHQVTFSQQHLWSCFSRLCSVTLPLSIWSKMPFSPSVISVLLKKHSRVCLTGKFTTRCLICLATGCVTPLCIHYSLKYRTSTFPCWHLDSAEILHKLQCFKNKPQRQKGFVFPSYLSVHLSVCVRIKYFCQIFITVVMWEIE